MDAQKRAQNNLTRRPAFAGGDMKAVVMPYVQFFGNSSFAEEEQSRIGYTITLKNTGAQAEDQHIAICPAYFGTANAIQTADGDAISAIIADGTIIATADKEVSCVGSPQPIERFFTLHQVSPYPNYKNSNEGERCSSV